MRRIRRAGALALAVAAVSGCGSLRLPFTGPATMGGSTMTEEELRNELANFSARFSATVDSAAEDISIASEQRTVRRRTLLWRMRMIPAAQTAAFTDPPQEAYLRILGLSIAQRLYLTQGEGRDLFGAQQEIAVTAANQVEQSADEIGAEFLTPERQAQVRADVEAVVAHNPILGRDFSLVRISRVNAKVQSSATLMSVLTFPLAPFKALEGVDSGAAAIRDFNSTAVEFSQVVAQLPEQLRGEMELLLYDVEDRETVQQSVAAIEQMAASADRASQAIAKLPTDLQKSLADSQGAIQDANKALLTARDVLVPLTQVSDNVKLAGDAWAKVVEKDPNAPPGRPFDVREWQSTAAQIGASAQELRALAAEINGLTGGQKIEDAVDHATWRGAQLLALFFGLLLVYRLLSWRLSRSAHGS